MSFFRELLLNHNHLRTLPYEMGKLFQLQLLGLGGNPLSKECIKLYSEANGTQKLITYLLDSLQGKLHTIFVSDSTGTVPVVISIVSWNTALENLVQILRLVTFNWLGQWTWSFCLKKGSDDNAIHTTKGQMLNFVKKNFFLEK